MPISNYNQCPGCGGKYFGKKERCYLWTNFLHATLNRCSNIVLNVTDSNYALGRVCNDNNGRISMESNILNVVLRNVQILDINYNWSQLSHLKVHYIKNYNPIIKHGLKASSFTCVLYFCWFSTNKRLTTETLGKVRNMFKVYNKDTRATSTTSFRCLHC